MQVRSLLGATLWVLLTSGLTQQSGHAQQTKAPGTFYCGTGNNGEPATLVDHPNRGQIIFIRWMSTDFGERWTPQKRCQEVSQRFQKYKEEGSLNYITSGTKNTYPVICTSETGNSCDNLLFTLKKGTNPSDVIREIMDIDRDASNAKSLLQSFPNLNDQSAIHVDTFLDMYAEVKTPVKSSREELDEVKSPLNSCIRFIGICEKDN